MNVDEWSARTFYFLFNQLNLLPDGRGKDQLAKLLLEAPQSVKDAGAQILIEMEKKNGS